MSRLLVVDHDVMIDGGQHHDLQELFAEANERYFGGGVRATIVWGPARRPRRRKKFTFANHYLRRRLIIVNRALDARWVPRFVMAFLVFHEMLHSVCRPRREGGRSIVHTPEFVEREKAHHSYARAMAWEAKNLDRLLRS